MSSLVFAQTNQVFDEEKLCLENRLKMKTWHIVFNRKIMDKEDSKRNNLIKNVSIYDIIRQRSDRTELEESLNQQIEPSTRTYIYDGKKIYSYRSGIDKDEAKWALEFQTLEGKQENDPSYYEVRTLGLHPSGMLYKFPLTEYITTSNPAISRSITDDVWDKIPCKKITYTFEGLGYSHCWIDPSKGYSVIRFEQATFDNTRREYTDLHVKKYKNTGIWYPSYCIFERYENKDLIIFEEMDIDVISINELIDDKYFNVASLNVPVGTMVADPELGSGNYVWDGKEVVSENFYRYGSGISPKSPKSRYLMLLAINLLVIGFYCLWKYHRIGNTTENKKSEQD
ncbi:MAG: hypothetical protein LBF88_08225 [Planctomycetaceae bacterium]|nr:hypothetical protein [Planctomycetaceae bacterium]